MKLNRSLLLLIGCMLLLTMLTGSVLAKEDVTAGRKQIVSKTLGKDAKFIDVNLVELGITNFGNVAYDPNAGGYQGLYYPAGQRWGSVIYTAGLWLVGDVNGDIRSAACQYSTEFQPGPILPNGSAPDPNDAAYQVFKFNKPLEGEPNPVTAEAIAQGCPPEVLGDQMLYAVYNDLGSHEYLNDTNPLGVEVQQTTWAYSATGALNNVVFIRFRVINKGGNDVNDAYVAMFYDPDLGDSNDDASGADTTRGYGYVYNGDGYDDVYGVQVPAMASDFFQGPIVDAPGETAHLNDGRVLADKRIMDQTAVFHFINGGPIAAMQDPHTAEEQYYFCQGLLSDGTPLIDPETGEETTFWFAGDPVSGEGWLYSDMMSPMDVRFGNSSGPFTLAAGDTQDIVLGIVIGQGSDNLKSIEVMRFYDEFAQKMYDANFGALPAPPQPIVEIAELDQALVIKWDDLAKTYHSDGYDFEGYNVYQGESAQGPWTKLATWDLVNGVTEIWDFEYSVDFGALIEIPVQRGADTGVRHTQTILEDAFTKTPLINGKPYFFAVTAYAYNPDEAPKVYENSPIAVTAVPQKPEIDTELVAEVGDEIIAEHVGPSQGSVQAIIKDPKAVTGHDYQVDFALDDDGETYWYLTDVTAGTVVLDKQYHQGFDENFAVVDGIVVKVQGPAPGLLRCFETNAADETVDNGVSIKEMSLGTTGYIVGNRSMAYNQTSSSYRDFDRFQLWGTDDFTFDFGMESCAWQYISEDPLDEKVPFALFRHQFSSGETQRMFPTAYSNDGDNVWNISWTDEWWGKPSYEPLYGYIAADGEWYDEANEAEYASTPLYDTHAKTGWDAEGNPVGYPVVTALMFIDYLGNGLPIGNKVKFITNKPNSPQDVFTFSTADYVKVQSEDIAKSRLKDINVYPNPYFAHNSAEGSFYTQFVTFNNLPEENVDIRIFSLNGELVKTISHTNGTMFERWYLKNEEDVPVSSGMYFAHIDTEYGNVILKVAIINRGAFFRNL